MDRRDDELDLPAEVKGALRGMYMPRGPYRGNDRAILAAARAAGARKPGRWRWAVGIGMAAAVALAVTLFVVKSGHWEPSMGRPIASVVPTAPGAEVQPNGDIRDAFYVARQLKKHEALPPRWDANHDGMIDERDVQAFALAAVSLDTGGKGEVR